MVRGGANRTRSAPQEIDVHLEEGVDHVMSGRALLGTPTLPLGKGFGATARHKFGDQAVEASRLNIVRGGGQNGCCTKGLNARVPLGTLLVQVVVPFKSKGARRCKVRRCPERIEERSSWTELDYALHLLLLTHSSQRSKYLSHSTA